MPSLDPARSKKIIATIVLTCLSASLWMSACLPAEKVVLEMPSPTSAPATLTATPTTVWFPPTSTRTPFPSVATEPTPSQVPGPEHGELILLDEFSDPEKWALNRTSRASAAINNNELTLALSQAGAYIYTIRQEPDLRDFYLEVTASPSLCMGADEYGVVFRFSDSSNFFRFSLTCDGRARVDRVFKSQPSSPQPLVFSGVIPPGAPSTSKLIVMSKGRDMTFYANNEFLFSVSDPNLPEGKIGLFIRSNGENAVTVNFSGLEIYRTNP